MANSDRQQSSRTVDASGSPGPQELAIRGERGIGERVARLMSIVAAVRSVTAWTSGCT